MKNTFFSIEMNRSIDCIMLQIVLSWVERKFQSRIPIFSRHGAYRAANEKSGELQSVLTDAHIFFALKIASLLQN